MLDQLLLWAAYVILGAFWVAPWVGVLPPVWLNLVVTATTVVFIGSHRSLSQLVTEEHGGGTGSGKKDTMSTKDVMQFPVVGSCALFGLFVAFKYYKAYATLILSGYFAVVGLFTLTNTLAPLVSLVFGSPKKYGFKRTFPLIGEVDAEFTVAELVSMIPAGIFAAIHFKYKGAMMNNVLGISFCVQAIEAISLGNYRNGALLLTGLFFYDIFWVFYSERFFGDNVMVSVAQNLDEPIKLLFPLSLPGNSTVVANGLVETLKQAKNATLIQSNSVFAAKNSACTTILNDIKNILGASYGNVLDEAGSKTVKDLAAAAILKAKQAATLEPKDFSRNCTKIIGTIMTPLKHAYEGKQSLLGLGDIVIPGLFVAILHRFDAVVGKVPFRGILTTPIPNFARIYFYTSIVFYALGLAATLWGMNKCSEWYPKGNCAQPALLYLVPACMLASLIVALPRGQLSELFKYDEEVPEETAKDKKE